MAPEPLAFTSRRLAKHPLARTPAGRGPPFPGWCWYAQGFPGILGAPADQPLGVLVGDDVGAVPMGALCQTLVATAFRLLLAPREAGSPTTEDLGSSSLVPSAHPPCPAPAVDLPLPARPRPRTLTSAPSVRATARGWESTNWAPSAAKNWAAGVGGWGGGGWYFFSGKGASLEKICPKVGQGAGDVPRAHPGSSARLTEELRARVRAARSWLVVRPAGLVRRVT